MDDVQVSHSSRGHGGAPAPAAPAAAGHGQPGADLAVTGPVPAQAGGSWPVVRLRGEIDLANVDSSAAWRRTP